MKFFPVLFIPFVALLSSCATTKVSLSYSPANGAYPVCPGNRAFQVAPFHDSRPGGREYLIGVVRAPVGVPMDYLETHLPVNVNVTNAFAYGLEARGMLTPGGARYTVTGEIQELTADQLVRPYASGRIKFVVRDPRSANKVVFSKVYAAELTEAPFSGGEDARGKLTELASQVLQQIVDKALDDEAFRSRVP